MPDPWPDVPKTFLKPPRVRGSVTRVAILRAGYAALGLAFLALAGTLSVGSLLLAGLGLALLGGLLLAFSDDDIPKWSGLALVAYFVLSALAFLAATPITIDRGDGYFVNPAPPELAGEVLYWMGLVSPLVLAAVTIAAAWERERAPRVLLLGAVAGFLLVGILSVALVTNLDPVCAADPLAQGCAGAAERAAAQARQQADLLRVLSAVSALAAAVGALWAASRPEEMA